MPIQMIWTRHIEGNVEDRKSLLLSRRQGTLKREKRTMIIGATTQMYILIRCHIIYELSDSFPNMGSLFR